ncbi:MAG: hypothetical protein Q8S18_12355 [Bacteroidales bacterium]|nr:hypothetical protein [Bacteroidales bacterium]
MRNLSLIILLVITLLFGLFAQSTRSPHGEKLKISCADCHHPDGWKMEEGRYSFTHSQTNFPLTGQHTAVDCKACHISLVFDEAEQDCISCHTDIHQQTTGPDCARCHSTDSWLVTNMTAIHRLTRFPLTGAHYSADCIDCHKEVSGLRFDPLPTECYSCHQEDYQTAKVPDHVAGNYSTNCIECHNINAFGWEGAGFNHAFFPLKESHTLDCAECHIQGEPYNSISQECNSCHLTDYQQAVNPNHQIVEFSTACDECHDLSPDWQPASFTNHDGQYFPIYSGEHNGEWESCTDCHTNSNDFGQFSCITCHEHNQSDMNDEHGDVNGYVYESKACFECHPSGSGDNIFDHNATSFPLTGAHNTVICSDCHTSGYSGTSTSCNSCHLPDFNAAVNPNHTQLGLSEDCALCHSTNFDWEPANFVQHNDYYELKGAHQLIAGNCFDCHQGNYVNSPNTCFGCHSEEYNQTTNPPHQAAQFSTSCELCHGEDVWSPATFDHDQQYFPIYSGNHANEWQNCVECHTIPDNYSVFSCIDCHEHNQPETDEQHAGIAGYAYASDACYACHPTGDGEGAFDHNQTAFPLTGAHTIVGCAECHSSGYTGTPTACFECHDEQYNQSVNPNHLTLNIPTDCAVCHTTLPGWNPASFPIHNNYFVLDGAHQPIANECAECHNGNYTSTPNTCFECHNEQYNQSVNPNHLTLNIPTDCAECHTTLPGWNPASFSIHNNYYVLEGAHQTITNECVVCHNGNYISTPNTCFGCHEQDYNQTVDPPHLSAQFPTECLTCHNQTVWEPSTFNHDAQYFPIYTGEHQGEWDLCLDCHTNPSDYVVFSCIDCHEHNQPETDEKHDGIVGYIYTSDACYACHPTGEGEGAFDHNQTDFPLTGAHTTVGCAECHISGYTGTPTVCFECHDERYNQSVNPDHLALNIPTECAECHTTLPDWNPASFPIHDNYYVLDGAHQTIANECVVCHNGNYNSTPNTCFECHEEQYNQSVNPDHITLNIPTECAECHTTLPDWSPASFPIHDNYYVLEGAHLVIANECVVCHNGNYISTPNSCFGCHETDYNQTVDPPHLTAQFPTECLLCHNQTVWEPSTFNHDVQYFPIYSGEHEGEWNFCSDCHTNPSNYAVFSCIDCHEHNQADMAEEHDDVSGYQWNSSACLECHPNGESDKVMIHRKIRNFNKQ